MQKKKGGNKVHENITNSILEAQNGDQDEMAKLIEENNRTNMEHSKKIYRKRI